MASVLPAQCPFSSPRTAPRCPAVHPRLSSGTRASSSARPHSNLAASAGVASASSPAMRVPLAEYSFPSASTSGRAGPSRSARNPRSPPPQSSAFLAAAPLAQYPFPSSMLRTGTLFSQAVRELVHNLSDVPFLQASFERRGVHERHAVQGDPLVTPSLWADTARAVCAGAPDLLFFVQPVASADAFCGEPTATAAGCGGHAAAAGGGSSLSDYVEGRVGTCCDDHESVGADPAHAALGMDDDASSAEYLREQGLSVKYYGVVAQSRSERALEGCYLMKTVEQLVAPGCHCMHYSFMHVCNGPGLREQSVSHWL